MTHRASIGVLLPYALRHAAAAALVAFAAGCQGQFGASPTISLEEAKRVTAQFSRDFVPPPRSANKVLSKLRELDKWLRPCDGSETLTNTEIGDMLENMSDRSRSHFLQKRAEEQFYRGNYERSIWLMDWAVGQVPATYRGSRARFLALLGVYQAHAGDFEAANRSINEANALLIVYGMPIGNLQRGRTNINFMFTEADALVAASEGRLVEAEALYRRALAYPNPSGWMKYHISYARIALSRILMQRGRLLEAESIVRDVLLSAYDHSAGGQILTAVAVSRFSEILYEQGRLKEAAAVSPVAVKIYRSNCPAPENLSYADARNTVAKILAAQGRWSEAVEIYDVIRADMAKDPASYRRLFAGDPERALALHRVGRTEEAVQDLKLALTQLNERLGAEHYRSAELAGFLAMLHLAGGDKARALAGFSAAAKILLARSREADGDSVTFKARDRRLALILDAYLGLLADIPGSALAAQAGFDPLAEAFRLADVPRLRSVQRALDESSARIGLSDPVLADLARREQDTRRRIAGLYGTLAGELAKPTGRGAKSIRATIKELRVVRAALVAEIERRFPNYADLINPKPLSLERARSKLRPGEALISTYVGEARTYVWALPYRGEVAFAAVPLGHKELGHIVATLRRALDPKAATLGDIPAFDVAAAHDLYSKLLAPVAAGWQAAKNLLIVAHGPLGHLPFSLLVTKPTKLPAANDPLFANYRQVPWLARSHAVTVLPAVASLTALRGLPAGGAQRKAFIGFGDPYFNAAQLSGADGELCRPASGETLGQSSLQVRGVKVCMRASPNTFQLDSAELARLPRLPGTAQEIKAIAKALNADPVKDVFLGKLANEERVKSMDLSAVKVVAFATHGLVPGDLNGLNQPALALTAPKIAGSKEGDGLLTMGEILGLKLDADWIVLSACNTGAGSGIGAEAISGLGRAFFYAGARALLVSNWPVETQSARQLTTALFRRQANDPGLDRAEALRLAMLELIDRGGFRATVNSATPDRLVYAYAHPIFWAPFSIIGDPGGAAGAANSSR